MESIVAKRELGSGRWDKALKRKMVELSVADNYDEAKEEWIATGEVWWAGNEEVPDWVANSQMGQGKCLCGHIVVYHFQIINTENGVVECVGSDHINTYLIMRAIAEDEGISIDAITDEKIQAWIDVRTKSMKAEAWWKANGAGFEMMFDSVKEMDLFFNVRETNKFFYDAEIERHTNEKHLRKRAEGQFGSADYKMASIVWRWNHPDNPKAQINTTGYPNDNLMKDLSLFYVMQAQYLPQFNEAKKAREQRIFEIAERKRRAEERLERERIARQEREAERLRIYNLPENVEKRRLQAIEEEKRLAEAREMRRLQEIEDEKRRKARAIQKQMEQEDTLKDNNSEFENMCGYYGIPAFDESYAGNDWEREFLSSVKEQMLSGKSMSDRQLNTMRRILTQEPATSKQINYLISLGYEGPVLDLTKMQASKLISEHIQ